MKKNLKYIIPILIINTLIILNIINFKISFISFFSLIILSSLSLYLTTILDTNITVSLHTNFLSFFYNPNISENFNNKINNIHNIEQNIFILIFALLYLPLHILIYFIYSFTNKTYLYIIIILILTILLYKYLRKNNSTISFDNYKEGINIVKLANKLDKERKEIKYQYSNYIKQRRNKIILESIYFIIILTLLLIYKNIFLTTFVIPLIFIFFKGYELDDAYNYIKSYNKPYSLTNDKLLPDFNSSITLKNISVHNFNNLTITFPKNHICMIYGPSLSGKTTQEA